MSETLIDILSGILYRGHQVSAAELLVEIDRDIDESEARIEAFDERLAIQLESWTAQAGWTGKSTTDRAIDSLRRPERFSGEHESARAWLRTDLNARIFTRSAQ